MIGRWRRGSKFVLGRGCVGFCDFPGPSIKDGGLEVAFMSRKEYVIAPPSSFTGCMFGSGDS